LPATQFGMTVEQCIAGVTCGAVRALGMEARQGSLEAGKYADLEHREPSELVYRMGFDSLFARVWRGQ
jgi:imidazolonepropionase